MIDFTRYNFTTDEGDSLEYLEISNSWSRKSIRFVFSDESGTTLWTLQNKCKFLFSDEYGNIVTEKDLPDCYESFNLELEKWINRKIIEHLDFLVAKVLPKKLET